MQQEVRKISELRSENLLIICVDPREQTLFRIIKYLRHFSWAGVEGSKGCDVWKFAEAVGNVAGAMWTVTASMLAALTQYDLLKSLSGLFRELGGLYRHFVGCLILYVG